MTEDVLISAKEALRRLGYKHRNSLKAAIEKYGLELIIRSKRNYFRKSDIDRAVDGLPAVPKQQPVTEQAIDAWQRAKNAWLEGTDADAAHAYVFDSMAEWYTDLERTTLAADAGYDVSAAQASSLTVAEYLDGKFLDEILENWTGSEPTADNLDFQRALRRKRREWREGAAFNWRPSVVPLR